ncbi:DNA-protecting protein DprA [Bacillaceae bacterium SIJ1]|uniref:DNA-processing protein DprA n=1 Tax=Litoribacterium kuwaitense TaxID=1398745 RepID=UPI0013EB059C|nr:DNA-processing protein DprA [Litoribacterium kuwaitense]NGP44139.1 DNA-protecting protein DprA [Litoribacterium kuwaitense]
MAHYKNALEYDATLAWIDKASPSAFAEILHLPLQQASRIHSELQQTTFKAISSVCQLHDISIHTRFDDSYPHLLRHIFAPPHVLYVKGRKNWPPRTKALSVVGSRHPSPAVRPALKHVLPPLVERNWCIVSGMAYGADRIAHEIAMHSCGMTIAVLGSGINHIYPRAHTNLAQRIVQQGWLVSEYPPNTPPRKWHFPARNRVISGLSQGVLIAEAKQRSGSLITAHYAVEQNRDVYVIPGSIYEPYAIGSNELIRDGATPVFTASDIDENVSLEAINPSIV